MNKDKITARIWRCFFGWGSDSCLWCNWFRWAGRTTFNKTTSKGKAINSPISFWSWGRRHGSSGGYSSQGNFARSRLKTWSFDGNYWRPIVFTSYL